MYLFETQPKPVYFIYFSKAYPINTFDHLKTAQKLSADFIEYAAKQISHFYWIKHVSSPMFFGIL